MISGINYEEKTEYCPYDYFFTSDAAIWGWATWKRVVEQWEDDYVFLDYAYEMERVKESIKYRNLRTSLIPMTKRHRKNGKQYYESILIMNKILQSGLAIVPKFNQITNIGMMGNSVHFNGTAKPFLNPCVQ